MKNKYLFLLIGFAFSVFMGCSKDGDINLFTKSQDVAFGKQLDSLVRADYNVVPRSEAPEAYAYLENMMNSILSSDLILYADEFPYQVTIVNDDVLNAFAAPGGYLYFYTGLMKYLDNGGQLAGVMAHEIAHADRRHSTENMTKVYGINILLSILLGNNDSKLVEIGAQLASGSAALAFSRNHEYEADEFAVKYNTSTMYHPKGVSGFFEKMLDENGSRTPEFLSTHPSGDNRIEEINEIWTNLGSPDGSWDEAGYQNFLNNLP